MCLRVGNRRAKAARQGPIVDAVDESRALWVVAGLGKLLCGDIVYLHCPWRNGHTQTVGLAQHAACSQNRGSVEVLSVPLGPNVGKTGAALRQGSMPTKAQG